jgi:methionyl-tRNA formyltransferase
MRFGFITCVQLGLSCMEAIYNAGGKLDFAMTLDDDMANTKSGRIYLDSFCNKHAVPLAKVRNINLEDSVQQLKTAELDWLFIIGWSQIAGPAVLQSPRRGVLGMHPTLLPNGRGRASIPWAILKGLNETGVTLFKLDEGVDTGPILLQARIPLAPDVDATALYARVDAAHIALMGKAFPKIATDALPLIAQDESKATYWGKRTPEDGRIDPQSSVEDAERLVRALNHPYPGAFVDLPNTKRVVWKAIILQAADDFDGPTIQCANGTLGCLDWTDLPGSDA